MEKLTVSAVEARQMMGISAKDLAILLNSGEINAIRRGNRWCIPVQCLNEYLVTQAEKEAWERRQNCDQK